MSIIQHPAPGASDVFYCGDCVTFTLTVPSHLIGHAWLRTNLNNAAVYRREIIEHTEKNAPVLSRDWHDLPMTRMGNGVFRIRLPLAEVGIFEAKCFFFSEKDQVRLWPEGGNTLIKVEPVDSYCDNTMYTAFVRQFGVNKAPRHDSEEVLRYEKELDKRGYTVIPPSGKFRDLIKELDFIVDELGCHIVQLLPIHPTPTAYARMGRYGSPFAAIDFFDVDPSYAEFDTHATPLEQFIELVHAVHARRAKIYIDIPVNHTGWASKEQALHPGHFVRENGEFISPGAWGIVWADLCKLDYNNPEVHHLMAEVFLFWCRHGVDGFRCDAGYMLPLHAWRYITARVREEFPDTIFMLEGLGGPIDVMERLLLEGNLNWAYSELFQNYTRGELEYYLPVSAYTSNIKGTLIHFAETHDNSRLAARSHQWAKLRTALCALSSHAGAFGFANGVEWLAEDKIDVHEGRNLNWGAQENLTDWLRRLQMILKLHPTFLPGADLQLVHLPESSGNVIALKRSLNGKSLLILCGLDEKAFGRIYWHKSVFFAEKNIVFDMLTGREHFLNEDGDRHWVEINGCNVLCLTNYLGDIADLNSALAGRNEHVYLAKETQEIRSLLWQVWTTYNAYGDVADMSIDEYISQFRSEPEEVIHYLAGKHAKPIMHWNFGEDETREVMVPCGCLLLVRHHLPFTFSVYKEDGSVLESRHAIRLDENVYVTCLFLKEEGRESNVSYRCCGMVYEGGKAIEHHGRLMALADVKAVNQVRIKLSATADEVKRKSLYAIFSNSLSGMTQVRGAWGEVYSKYDALLSANVNREVPVDHHVMFSLCKIWCLYHGYSQEVNIDCLTSFTVHPDNQAMWHFEVPCGQGKCIALDLILTLERDNDHVQIMLQRRSVEEGNEAYVDNNEPVQLVLRPFIEDRVCHSVTHAYLGPERDFGKAVTICHNGFDFNPSGERKLKVFCDAGSFYHSMEWNYMVYYKEDHERGLEYNGDIFSPGYFSIEMFCNKPCCLHAAVNLEEKQIHYLSKDILTDELPLETCLKEGLKRFMVKRDQAKTIIAGYPWFLDWGRDSLICLRGYLAAGYLEEVKEALITFASAELEGTLPNMIRGNDYSNRDTTDAPLWLAVVLDDYAEKVGNDDIFQVECAPGRTIFDVLSSIVEHYRAGTYNGIFMDQESGLIHSPSHFTWMDTNYPAATPRKGYPIEIQALWWRTLSVLARVTKDKSIKRLAEKVHDSFLKYYVVEGQDFLVDCLHAAHGESAERAIADDACRCNQLMAITLGMVKEPDVCKRVLAATERLLIPGSIRSLAKLPVCYGIPVQRDGQMLNDPYFPYWGQYIGDEDTRRKPAYHNGTGWGWVFPHYAEALWMTNPTCKDVAISLLASTKVLLEQYCLGQLPENSDGDFPHTPRGCGAQAWSMTEAYRVLCKLR